MVVKDNKYRAGEGIPQTNKQWWIVACSAGYTAHPVPSRKSHGQENHSPHTCLLEGKQRPPHYRQVALTDFVQNPRAYDLHGMVPDEDMQEVVRDCENLRKYLYK